MNFSVFGILIFFFVYNFHLSFSILMCLTKPIPEQCDIFMEPTNKSTILEEIFPDAINCRASYSGSPTFVPPIQRYECPNGFIYNSWTKTCELEPENVTDICEGRRADCRIHETYTDDKWIPFPSNPAYYVHCFLKTANDTSVTLWYDVYRCTYEYLQEYVDIPNTFGGCRFACREKGFFQNPTNCREYVYCTGPKAVPTVMSCAINYVYDGTQCTSDKTKCKYP